MGKTINANGSIIECHLSFKLIIIIIYISLEVVKSWRCVKILRQILSYVQLSNFGAQTFLIPSKGWYRKLGHLQLLEKVDTCCLLQDKRFLYCNLRFGTITSNALHKQSFGQTIFQWNALLSKWNHQYYLFTVKSLSRMPICLLFPRTSFVNTCSNRQLKMNGRQSLKTNPSFFW